MLTTHIMCVSNCIIVRKEDNVILYDPNKHNIMLTHFLPQPFTQNYYSHQFFGKVYDARLDRYLSYNLKSLTRMGRDGSQRPTLFV